MIVLALLLAPYFMADQVVDEALPTAAAGTAGAPDATDSGQVAGQVPAAGAAAAGTTAAGDSEVGP